MSSAPVPHPPGATDRVTDFTIPLELAGVRLDRALATLAGDEAGLSRSRLTAAIGEGALRDQNDRVVAEPSRKVKPGERFRLVLPPAAQARPEPEAIPLDVLYEDADLIVVDKPAGMVVHPAPGAETGTLVNALLAHCGESLTGIGAERRPGIVHRIDKDTSGVLVVAKTQAAHATLSAGFADHTIERAYLALAHGAPDRADPRLSGLSGVSFETGGVIRIETDIARHPTDRKRMAVARSGRGKRAVTRLRTLVRFGPAERPLVSLLECQLETGRTHQIRVHATYAGHALIGDPVYGGRRAMPGRTDPAAIEALSAFPRQALHAARLGFAHPITGDVLTFTSPLPQDMHSLIEILRRTAAIIR
ncbi:MAG: RluA family pseudouridine synthase [Pseudomonadota bacterium]